MSLRLLLHRSTYPHVLHHSDPCLYLFFNCRRRASIATHAADILMHELLCEEVLGLRPVPHPQNTTGRTERRWLNCLGAATWPEVVRRYCLFHMAKFQDPQITDAASESLTRYYVTLLSIASEKCRTSQILLVAS